MTEQALDIINYIKTEIIGDPEIVLDEDTPLVSSGLIDSMALVDILAKLEDVVNMRIPAGKVQAKNMNTVRLMLTTAERVGKARQAR